MNEIIDGVVITQQSMELDALVEECLQSILENNLEDWEELRQIIKDFGNDYSYIVEYR